MTHLRIEQNTGQTEEVNASIISKLYELAFSGDLDDTSDLKGRLHSSVGYQDEIDYLNNKYSELYINSDNLYIRINDPVVQQICATTWGDGTGLTTVQASSVTSIGDVFKNNTSITDLRCLQYFTGLQSINTYQFNHFAGLTNLEYIYIPDIYRDLNNGGYSGELTGLSNLKYVRLPNNLYALGHAFFKDCINLEMSTCPVPSDGRLNDNTFHNCSKITISQIPDGIQYIGTNCFINCTSITNMTIANTVTNIDASAFLGCSNLESIIFEESNSNITFGGEGAWSGGIFKGVAARTINIKRPVTELGGICLNCPITTIILSKSVTPPSSSYNIPNTITWYVPDESVNDYKSATSWSNVASNIYSINDLPQNLQSFL